MYWQIIGVLGPYILLTIASLYLWLSNKLTYLEYFGVGTAFNLFLNFILKSLIKQPRPKEDLTIGEDTDINTITNLNQYEFGLSAQGKRQGSDRYGMPSGHAQTTAYVLAFMQHILSRSQPQSHLSNQLYAYPYVPLFALMIAIAFATILQRVIYKHHTLLQVIVGLIIGAFVGTITFRMARIKVKGNIKAKEDDNYTNRTRHQNEDRYAIIFDKNK